jgi:hypothetical protein
MLKYITRGLADIFERDESPIVRLAEIEYSIEFRHLQKHLGRRPTELEARQIISNLT